MIAGIDFRPITPEDIARAVTTFSVSFGWTPTPEDIAEWDGVLEYDRSLAAFDADQLVATSAAITFEMTVPGGVTVPVAGVTAVSVLPTHRRRGILSEIMRRELSDFRERGEPLAILLASESVIYGRFGYGLATTQVDYEIERRSVTLRQTALPPGATVVVDRDEAARVIPDFYDRIRRAQPGFIRRDESWWKHSFEDLERNRRGASGRFYVLYREGGELQGYLAYRIKPDWQGGLPQNELQVVDMMTESTNAYSALWQYLAASDLVGTIVLQSRPIDEPIRWMLSDPRRLRFRLVADHLWVRLVDVVDGLTARRYAMDGVLTLAVTDRFCPQNEGVYRLEGGPDGAICQRTDAEPDLALGVEDLGAAYLSGATFETLRRAGRVEELSSGAVHRADLLFAPDRAPWCANHF